jgi:hypothetical protein
MAFALLDKVRGGPERGRNNKKMQEVVVRLLPASSTTSAFFKFK